MTMFSNAAGVLRASPAAPVLVDGPYRHEVELCWACADAILVSLISPAVSSEDGEVGQKKWRAIRAHLDAWPLLRDATLLVGRIDQLSPAHEHVIAVAPPTQEVLDSGFAATNGAWAPPDGWEDLVLLRGASVVAWASTHNKFAVVSGAVVDNARRHVADDVARLIISWRRLKVPSC